MVQPIKTAGVVASAFRGNASLAQGDMADQKSGAADATNHVLYDSIYGRIFEDESVYGSNRSTISKLRRMLSQALGAGPGHINGAHETQFANITVTPDKEYFLKLQNGDVVTRSEDEIELHVLLQSQVRLTEEYPVDHGDSIAPEFLQQPAFGILFSSPSQSDLPADRESMPVMAVDVRADENRAPQTRAEDAAWQADDHEQRQQAFDEAPVAGDDASVFNSEETSGDSGDSGKELPKADRTSSHSLDGTQLQDDEHPIPSARDTDAMDRTPGSSANLSSDARTGAGTVDSQPGWQRRPPASEGNAEQSRAYHQIFNSDDPARSRSLWDVDATPLSQSPHAYDDPALHGPNVARDDQVEACEPDNLIDYIDLYGNGNCAHTFTNDEVDMQKIGDHCMDASNYRMKAICGSGNNCWWRSCMLSVLLQCPPDLLERRIMEKLGPQYEGDAREDAAALRNMAHAVQSGDLHSIFTGTEGHDSATGFSNASKLKLAGCSDAQDAGRGDGLCKKVVQHLLRSCTDFAECLNDAFDNQSATNGDNTLSMHVHDQLQVDCVFYSKGWPVYSDETETGIFDVQEATLGISATAASALATVRSADDKDRASTNLLDALNRIPRPVLVLEMGHINVAIPVAFAVPGRERAAQDLAARAAS